MSVKQKREKVLEKIYDEFLEGELEKLMPNAYLDYASDGKKSKNQQPIVQLIVALENAQAADEEMAFKEENLEFDVAHHDIDRKHADRVELAKLLITAIITIVTNVGWGYIFVHELEQTRKFEIDGTERSAAGRWLKQDFPKPNIRLF